MTSFLSFFSDVKNIIIFLLAFLSLVLMLKIIKAMRNRNVTITRSSRMEIGGPLNGRAPGGAPTAEDHNKITLFKHSNDPEFVSYFISKLTKARTKVILIGTGLSVLNPIEIKVIKNSLNNCPWEIFLADPDSEKLDSRLDEEEQMTEEFSAMGKSGIKDRIKSLLLLNNPRLTLKLFPNYPTLSMYVIDNDYFFYPYGCGLIGNFSPVLEFKADEPSHKPIIDFLNNHRHNIEAISKEASANDIQKTLSP